MKPGSLNSSVRDQAGMPSENRAKILPMSASSLAPDRPIQQTAGELSPAISPRYSRAQLAQYDGSDPNLAGAHSLQREGL